MKEDHVIDYLEKKIINQLKLMIPDRKFGCIVSGGIDSTLQAKLINNISNPFMNMALDYGSKDPIMKNLKKFNQFFKKKIQKKKVSISLYKKLAHKCYDIVSSPLQTHDLPGRFYLSKIFKKKNCKVFFSADGCDELLGGQQVYLDCFKKKFDDSRNASPYSSIIKNHNTNIDRKVLEVFLNNKWKKIFKKYSFIKSIRERSIQSSLFLDYFIQSTAVSNRANDLICSENSIEARNVFIQKDILKVILNLPLKYKINEKVKDQNFKQKYILKKIFSKYFSSEYIYKKTGFSGHPNSLIDNSFGKSKLIDSILFKKKKIYSPAL